MHLNNETAIDKMLFGIKLQSLFDITVWIIPKPTPVSYTHLDVYKRQVFNNTCVLLSENSIVQTDCIWTTFGNLIFFGKTL